MKQFLVMALLAIGIAAAFSGCERNDYQHPLHRSNNK